MKNNFQGFTPLETCLPAGRKSSTSRRLSPYKANGGLKPPLALTVREPRSLTGFTVLELIIVMVIIGILAALGLANFAGPKEQAVDREAQASLKLISSAEKIYRMEIGGYVNCSNTSVLNANLRLMIPASDTNWKYRVTGAGASVFSAAAQRTSGPYSGTKLFCIDQVLDNATNSSCGSPW